MIQNLEPKPLSDDWFDGDPGCHACNGTGWRHGCMDDLCRGSTEDEDCPDAIQCMVCNPEGDWF
ncbi:hypothetical protein [Brevundimonas diminuta]|uniref:hypothetical protein n=1 Tax=Brevundimonas diminuta TaxID=293 RepID=UPI003F80898B